MLNWQDVGFSLNTLILIFIECILPPAHADTLEQYNLYQDRYIHCIHTYIPHIYGHKQSLSIYLGHTIKIKKIVGPKVGIIIGSLFHVFKWTQKLPTTSISAISKQATLR